MDCTVNSFLILPNLLHRVYHVYYTIDTSRHFLPNHTTSANVNYALHILANFQTYFTDRFRRKFVLILSLKISHHTSKCVATLPCEMVSVLKATIGNKTTSVTTHFKKLTTVTV